MIVPIFLPHLGCQTRCIYCDQDAITDIEAIDLQTRIGQSLIGRRNPVEVGLYGGNIFGLHPEALKRLFSYFDSYRSEITNFRVSTKPLPINNEIIDILKKNGATTVELGIPTFNDRILELLNRKHTAEDLINAFDVLKNKGFQVALQVMVGLPHETRDDIWETVKNILSLKPSFIRIYPLAFISGTPLVDMYTAGKFSVITIEEAIHRAMLIYLSALRHEIKTVKMGLTDNEVIKNRIVGGYYHPAFGFLVKSLAFYLAIITKIYERGFNGQATIHLNNRDVPHLLGHKRTNLARFLDAGIAIDWKVTNIPPGKFILIAENKEIQGNIFDALSHVNNQQQSKYGNRAFGA